MDGQILPKENLGFTYFVNPFFHETESSTYINFMFRLKNQQRSHRKREKKERNLGI